MKEGRLKDQAFVQFADVSAAARTLDLEAPDAAALHSWVRALTCWQHYGAAI